MLSLHFVAANPHPRIIGLDRLPGIVNYFIGKNPSPWQTRIPAYGEVLYENLYPGIDLRFYGRNGMLEYDWIVHPGANSGRTHLWVAGTRTLRLGRAGSLLLGTALGSVPMSCPKSCQGTGSIASRYVLQGRIASFQLGPYDRNKTLVIDPALVYSTYLRGSGVDIGNGAAVDSCGNAYVTGYTDSTDFPTKNPYQSANAGREDTFVTEVATTQTNRCAGSVCPSIQAAFSRSMGGRTVSGLFQLQVTGCPSNNTSCTLTYSKAALEWRDTSVNGFNLPYCSQRPSNGPDNCLLTITSVQCTSTTSAVVYGTYQYPYPYAAPRTFKLTLSGTSSSTGTIIIQTKTPQGQLYSYTVTQPNIVSVNCPAGSTG